MRLMFAGVFQSWIAISLNMDYPSTISNLFGNSSPFPDITDIKADSMATINTSIMGNSTEIEKTGSTPLELFLLSFVIPGASLLLSLIAYMGFGHAVMLNFLVLMEFTVCSDYIHQMLYAIGCSIFLTMYFISRLKSSICEDKNGDHKAKKSHEKVYSKQSILDIELSCEGGQIPFLTDYRGHLLLATAVGILAVDFAVFPSRFSKTTSFGWSVMDAGVGCFVAVHGMCSSQARGRNITSLKKSLLSSMPLLLLGFTRLILVTAVNYHRSVSEYGVHWNFFFTLAITKMACSLLFKTFPFINSGLLALGLIICHQWLLSACGVSDLILSANRNNLFEENKEGICSIPGFIVIYLEGVEIGKLFWKPRCKMKDWIRLFAILVAIGLFGWTLMLILHNNVQNTSRRMANFPYCIWVVALTSLQIAIHLLEHLTLCIFRHKISSYKNKFEKKHQRINTQSSLLWQAINHNGLFFFLLANILTGIVNIYIDTDNISTFGSMAILLIYVYTLSITVILMMKFSIKVKFW